MNLSLLVIDAFIFTTNHGFTVYKEHICSGVNGLVNVKQVNVMDEKLAIVVPCYNEFKRLPKDDFISFIKKNKTCKIIFSDDGSKDNTLEVLKEIKAHCPDRVFINVLENNGGKARAVRSGVYFVITIILVLTKLLFWILIWLLHWKPV